MVDHSQCKLGKQAARHDKRTLMMANYVTGSLPAPPDAIDYTKQITNLGVMLNNQLGDCTAAGVGHLRQAWTATNGNQKIWGDDQIQTIYSLTGGYVPGNDLTDNGAVEIDVLNYWRQTGFYGDQITAYMALEPNNSLHIKQAIQLFGGVYGGYALPKSAQNQTVFHLSPGGTAGDASPGSWGGHCMVACAYNHIGPIVITWGIFKQTTWQWWNAYCDESYAILSSDWAAPGVLAPSGLSLNNLKADLQLVTA
jgi:hypothetical protein